MSRRGWLAFGMIAALGCDHAAEIEPTDANDAETAAQRETGALAVNEAAGEPETADADAAPEDASSTDGRVENDASLDGPGAMADVLVHAEAGAAAACPARSGSFSCSSLTAYDSGNDVRCDRATQYCQLGGNTFSCVPYVGSLSNVSPNCGACPTCACFDVGIDSTCGEDDAGGVLFTAPCYGAPPAA
jgi:hypothetical protein